MGSQWVENNMAVHSEKGTDTDKKLLGCIPEKKQNYSEISKALFD